MPTYEYECKSCGGVMELFQSITAAPLRKAKCETCGKERAVKRLIGTGGGVIFKGSGFYQTDYRNEGYKTAAKADKAPESAGGSDAKKSDTVKADEKKPAASAPSPASPPPAASPEASAPKSAKRSTSRRKA